MNVISKMNCIATVVARRRFISDKPRIALPARDSAGVRWKRLAGLLVGPRSCLPLLALLLAGCSSRAMVEGVAWAILLYTVATAFLIGLLVGVWRGRELEASRWRSKGNDPPQGGGRVLSGGRFYWVCAEDAAPEARQFVAHMLLDQREDS